MILSYIEGCSMLAIALAMRTANTAGNIWDICPVSSNTIILVDIVCVTAPDNAAAPAI